MKARFLFINLLFLIIGVQIGFSQTIKPLPENVKSIAARSNQSLLGENAFVFDPAMNPPLEGPMKGKGRPHQHIGAARGMFTGKRSETKWFIK